MASALTGVAASSTASGAGQSLLLQRHLNHYLRLLFPNTSVEINEHLTLGRISRQVGTNTESAGLDQQSFDAREQLGLIGRLAYADLLKEAGRR